MVALSSIQLALLLVLVAMGAFAVRSVSRDRADVDRGSYSHSAANSACNVQVVPLYGVLDTSYGTYQDGTEVGAVSSEIIARLKDARANSQIKAVILDVDSPGGSPVAGEDVSAALRSLGKPSAAWIRTMGTSAAYWASLGASRIVASENSSVGSIGVTSSYVDRSEKNRQDGLSFVQLSLGRFKDTGNPDKPLTDEEKKLVLTQLQDVYDSFVRAVAEARHLSVEQVRQLADGSDVLGSRGKELRLVDQTGGLPAVESYLERELGEPIDLCWE